MLEFITKDEIKCSLNIMIPDRQFTENDHNYIYAVA